MSASAESFVLDSFALLAHLEEEPGAGRVRELLRMAPGGTHLYMSRINIGELVYITHRERGLVTAQTVLNAVEQLPIKLLEATRERVYQAAHIKAKHAVSYADAFAVAAALELSATVLTGDLEFASVSKIVNIEWLARR